MGRKPVSEMTPEERERKLAYQKEYDRIHRERRRIAQKARRAANPERVAENNRRWRQSHPEQLASILKAWADKNKEKRRSYRKEWLQANKERHREYKRNYENQKLKSDPSYWARSALRTRLNQAIKDNAKLGSAVRDLGCTIEEFWAHMESKFQPGMTRENRGRVWEIDHIYPLAKASLHDRVEFLAANNWRNLQPLTPEQNNDKGDKVTPEAQALFDRLCAEFREQVAA